MSTCENYWAYSHETIRHEMHNGDGPASQGDVMVGWHQLAERLSNVRHYVDTAIVGVQTSQQGAAADAAVGAMSPLGAWVDQARRLAIDTRNKIDEQIGAFTTAKGNVPEVPPEPRGWGWKDIPVIDAFTTSDQEVHEAVNRDLERQARAAMASYQDGTNTRLVNLTQFAPPPAGEPNLAIPTGERSEIGGFPGAGEPGGSGSPGSGAAPGSPTTLAGVAGAAPAGPTAAAPAPTSPQGGGGIGGPEYAGVRAAAGAPAGSGGFLPGVPVVAGPVGGASNRVSRSGVPGGDGVRSGAVRGGSVAHGAGFSGGRVPSTAGLGSHSGAGSFGPTGSSESAAARAASASAAGAGRPAGAGVSGGAPPFGAMGAGGGSGGEDKERRRPSYLVESDSHRLIGDLPRTAPSVIGEDPPDYGEPHRR